MRNVLAVARKDLSAAFYSPVAYIVLGAFIIMNNVFFWLVLKVLSLPQAPNMAPMQLFFGDSIFLWLFLFIVVPVITMRLLAAEKRSGSIEMLMTAPVRDVEVVLGKYLAALGFYIVLWLPTLAYVAVLMRFARPDLWTVAAGYLGVLLIGGFFLSMGLFASSLTKSQIGAAMIAFALLFTFWLIGIAKYFSPGNVYLPGFVIAFLSFFGVQAQAVDMAAVVDYLNVWDHMREFSHGLVDSRRLVLYGSGIVFWLFLTTRVVESRKWR